MRALLLIALSACTAEDYKTPGVGITAAGGVQQCKDNPFLPCGWVYDCGDTELCLPWEDRAEIPKLKQTAESIYGSCEYASHPRFAGTPLCRYQCPSAQGCNSVGGCFCLEPAS